MKANDSCDSSLAPENEVPFNGGNYRGNEDLEVGNLIAVSTEDNAKSSENRITLRINGKLIYPTTTQPQQLPRLDSLNSIAEWLPLGMRKKIKAMAADYADEIRCIHARGEYRKAQWNKRLAWGYAIWYVVRGPVDAVKDWLIASFKGN
ncbi:MAG: hypothetical protein Q8K29_12270 [Polaromonas sp.]|nr:hypothetical protein [Polaromonas sp.]